MSTHRRNLGTVLTELHSAIFKVFLWIEPRLLANFKKKLNYVSHHGELGV